MISRLSFLDVQRQNLSIRNTMTLTARLLVGGVLCFAGFLKATGPSAEFAGMLEAYRLFPPSLIAIIAKGAPWIEMWVGIFLIAGCWTRWAAIASSVLYGGFIVVLASTLARGIDLASCGCFGQIVLSPRHTLVVDTVCFLSSMAIAVLTARRTPFFSIDAWDEWKENAGRARRA